jgi:hypothetical protein
MSRFLIFAHCGSLLAILLLFLTIWGWTGIGKLVSGYPEWFPGKFGATFFAKFPGLHATFWILTVSELAAFALAAASLLTGEFLPGRQPRFLALMLTWSLFVFVQLSVGQWLTSDYNATPQLFAYFAGTLLALMHVTGGIQAPFVKRP